MDERDQTSLVQASSSSSAAASSSSTSREFSGAVTTPSSSFPVREEEEAEEEEGAGEAEDRDRASQLVQQRMGVSYHVLYPTEQEEETSTYIRDDTWSCIIVVLTFWFFVSMTLILGVYGAVNLQLGPNCSLLITTNPLFVEYIKVEQVDESETGPVLYGFYKDPPRDAVTSWSQTHNISLPAGLHKEWVYILNEGSQINISYGVNSPSLSSLILIIAQGSEGFAQWLEDPSYPNTTLSWNVIHGSGTIQQDILESSSYYIAVGNLNSEEVEVQLNIRVKAFLYNTTEAYYNCAVAHGACSLKMFFPSGNTAVLTSPGPEQVGAVSTRKILFCIELRQRQICPWKSKEAISPLAVVSFRRMTAFTNCASNNPITIAGQLLVAVMATFCALAVASAYLNLSSSWTLGTTSDMWYVKLSYGPRWITYLFGVGGMTVLMLLAFHLVNNFQSSREEGTRFQFGETRSERAPLLSQKDDDMSSWGSSYDSISEDDEDLEDGLAVGSLEGKPLKDGEYNNNIRRLCAICFDAPRDCFFLPCGHCVACFACGTRIAELAGTCPICRRNMKKVRRIFTV